MRLSDNPVSELTTNCFRFHNIAFFAMKFVKAGEELCWDYNYEIDMTRTEDKKLNCNCGASNCRGRLL